MARAVAEERRNAVRQHRPGNLRLRIADDLVQRAPEVVASFKRLAERIGNQQDVGEQDRRWSCPVAGLAARATTALTTPTAPA